ncbi:beta-2 adrenergic receptor [Hydra vulgaris]|uniref:beta-2 adrenergic receptor n=1 Tax=Hydra vulgaris TaxID=6087 RepID=UPI001F5F19D5|nr:beta-2 adrenergic receptor-like [Hydra vulgaris]
MICWRTKLNHLSNLIILGILLCVATIVATVTNMLVLIIIARMKKRSISYHILLSLATADFFVGLILGPITAIQVFDVMLLENCLTHTIRSCFLILLVGSSLSSLALVAYDRYLLLTKLHNYNKYMTKKKVIIFILLSWFVPGIIPIARQFNMTAFVVLRVAVYTLPLVALIVFYFLITMDVRKKERNLSRHQINQNVAGSDNSSTCENSNSHETAVVEIKRHYNFLNSGRKIKHIKLAKSVLLLIVCYFVSIFPLNIWMMLELANLNERMYSNLAHQIFYFGAIFLMQVNSCVNPVIYYLKKKEIRRGFHQIFKKRL